MSKKLYTLYYRGYNKYGHEHNVPIISLNLRELDEFTSNFNNYLDLYNNLPVQLKTFLKNNLMNKISENEDLNNCFFITDSDFKPIMDVVFKDNLDVLYIEKEELDEYITKLVISHNDYKSILLNVCNNKYLKNKYNFFKYLYETYVKDKKIECMIDVYDTNNAISNLSSYDLILASIATDKKNTLVLCKKLNQFDEQRRNLAFEYKKLFNKSNEDSSIITDSTIKKRIKKLDKEKMDKIFDNYLKFKKKYELEYLKNEQ